jgi:hypothetical protein
MSADARGWRVALLPDALVNPPDNAGSALPDVLGVLESAGYGVLQLPPLGEQGPLLAAIADQVAEYAHHGYAVAAVGVHGEPGGGLHWRRLAALLRRRGVALLPRHLVRPGGDTAVEAEKLTVFLSGYDVSVEEQRRWRV